MGKKDEKRLCWNCDGYVHFYLDKCPYCSVSLVNPENGFEPAAAVEKNEEKVLAPPYGAVQNYAITEEEWKHALDKGEEEKANDEDSSRRNDLNALLLLLPGAVFLLFGLTLIFFSKEGTLTLEWRESYAYFYFLGALPLLALGWKALR